MQPIDFWIEYGSTYTYLSVARIAKLAAASNVDVRWQPFFVMPIMAELGLTQGPFLPFPSKTAYMWRDIERRAARNEVPYTKPSTYPVNSLLTARIACIAAEEGWCQPFTEGVFRLHWTQNILIGSDGNLRTVLNELGRSPSALMERAQTQVVKDKLKLQTERAKSLGIFGAPSFTVGQELFWGDDRLEEAIEWARTH
jgi:2-hydroxychromene-2-carboxylate isomerase